MYGAGFTMAISFSLLLKRGGGYKYFSCALLLLIFIHSVNVQMNFIKTGSFQNKMYTSIYSIIKESVGENNKVVDRCYLIYAEVGTPVWIAMRALYNINEINGIDISGNKIRLYDDKIKDNDYLNGDCSILKMEKSGYIYEKITDYIDDRKNSFDLIRLFAALLVLYAHSYHIFGLGADPLTAITGIYSGTIAVYMFFCISGFFISKSVVERTPLEFIVARCARIFPALFFCNLFTITLILPWVLVDRSWFDFVFSLESVSYIYINTSLLWGLEFTMPIVFDAHPDQAVNGSLWTLPVELQAYVLVFLFLH